MAEPNVPQKSPYIYKAEKDQQVAWCSCGRSQKQPFCDGSHRGSEFRPVLFDIKAGETYAFCGCKHTGTPPICNGKHKEL